MKVVIRAASLCVVLVSISCEKERKPDQSRPFVPPGAVVMRSRSIPAETAMRAVGLRAEEKRDTGDASWRKTFRDARGLTDISGVRRDFTLILANESAEVRSFRSTIEYVSPEGALIRTRTLEQLVVPPFAENSYYGYTILNPPGEATVTCHVEMIVEEETGSRPGEGSR